MNKSLTYAVVGIMAAGIVAHPVNSQAQIKPQGGKHLFRIKWAKGDTYKFRNKTFIVAPGMTAGEPMTMDYSMSVKSVSNGTATVDVKGAGQATGNQTSTVKIDSRGKAEGSGDAAAMFSNEFTQFPEKPIAIGDSWKATGSVGGMGGNLNITATNTFKGFKTVEGKQMAHIATTMKISGSGMTGTGTGDLLYVVSNGMTFRATIKMNMQAPNPQGGQPMNIKVTNVMNRL